MPVGAAAVCAVVAAKFALLGTLIYRGHTGLIAGYQSGGRADDAAIGRRVGRWVLALAAVTAGLAALELSGGASNLVWTGDTLLVVGLAGWLSVDLRE
ncbi:MAG: hypothetical protein ABEJ68_03595 [Halobacteriaceae archaeon]